MRTIKMTAIAVQQYIAGIQQELASAPSVMIDNVVHTPADMVQTLSAFLTAITATTTARLAYRGAVARQKALQPGAIALIRGLHAYVFATYGNTAAPLAAFGILPHKQRVVSAAVKAAAALKAKATYALHHPKAKVGTTATAETAPAAAASPTVTTK